MDPLFLLLDEVLEIHEQQIERYGGASGVRDAAALESAIATPQATFGGEFLHRSMPAMAAFSRLIGWFVALSFGLLVAGSTLANAGSDSACGHGYPLCNGSLFPSLNHLVVIALIHRVWAGALLVLALWVLLRSRRRSE